MTRDYGTVHRALMEAEQNLAAAEVPATLEIGRAIATARALRQLSTQIEHITWRLGQRTAFTEGAGEPDRPVPGGEELRDGLTIARRRFLSTTRALQGAVADCENARKSPAKKAAR